MVCSLLTLNPGYCMHFIFEQIQTGGDRNFGYLIADGESKTAALVDPSYCPDLLVARAEVQGLQVKYIFNTHGHGDHTNGNHTAVKLTGGQVAAYQGSSIQPDFPLTDGQMVPLGGLTLKILHTPGHSEDHIVIFVSEYQVAFSGDHLFVGKIGGTGTESSARVQYASFEKLYSELPLETTIWPGHNVGCRPSSTLAIEKASNPFLMVDSFDAFYNLKSSWSTYKHEHGLL